MALDHRFSNMIASIERTNPVANPGSNSLLKRDSAQVKTKGTSVCCVLLLIL